MIDGYKIFIPRSAFRITRRILVRPFVIRSAARVVVVARVYNRAAIIEERRAYRFALFFGKCQKLGLVKPHGDKIAGSRHCKRLRVITRHPAGTSMVPCRNYREMIVGGNPIFTEARRPYHRFINHGLVTRVLTRRVRPFKFQGTEIIRGRIISPLKVLIRKKRECDLYNLSLSLSLSSQ